MQQWVQVLTPFVAALIVLIGVVLTIRSNNRKAQYERLEQRAKDRETALQTTYADFGSAGYGVLACVGLIRGCLLARQQQDSGTLKLTPQQHEDRRRETQRRFDEANALSMKNLEEARTAYARLTLLDDSQQRLEKAYNILNALYQLPYSPDDQGVNHKVESSLQLFLADVAKQLDAEYLEGHRLAKECEPYRRRNEAVRSFAGTPTKIT